MFDNIQFMEKFINGSPLPESEIRNLISSYQSGDTDAVVPIISSFSKLIISLIPYDKQNTEAGYDLYQSGVIGLINAAKKFNLDHHTKFITYAYAAIKNAMGRSNQRLMSIPVDLWKDVVAFNQLMQKNADLSDDKICDALNISKDRLDKIKQHSLFPFPCDISDSCAMNSFVPDISDSVIQTIDTERLHSFIDEKISQEEKDVLSLKFGLGCERHTFPEIGKKCGMKADTARKMYRNSINKLRKVPGIAELAKEYL